MSARVPIPSAIARYQSSDPDLSVTLEKNEINLQTSHEKGEESQDDETLIAEELNNTLVIRNNASIDGFSSPFYGKVHPSQPLLTTTEGNGVQEITGIPKHYLDQSSVLKYLAQEIQTQPTNVPMHPPNQQLNGLQLSPNGVRLLSPQDENGNKIITLLSQENFSLKNELELLRSKASRLERLEAQLSRVDDEQKRAMIEIDKRENAHQRIRMMLEQEIQKLKNAQKAQPDIASYQQEFARRDLLIAQLLSQNKELLCEKERKDVEIQAQNTTLAAQRNHIDIMERALTNAQANIVRYEEEIRKKEFYVDRVNELQKALQQMQAASERRLEMEKKMRAELEKDVQSLGRKGGDGEELRKTIRDYEEKVVALEGEVARLEQKYLEASALRQMAVDAVSVPKDARIAALERNSLETERLISQARTEKLRQMDELHANQRKCAEVESRLKDMESKLAEKDAMIRVLQQRSSIHARAASSVALTHHLRTNSKDDTIPDRAALDESLKEFGSRLANKTSLLRTAPCSTPTLQLSSPVSKSTSNLNIAAEGRLAIPPRLGDDDESDSEKLKEWCV